MCRLRKRPNLHLIWGSCLAQQPHCTLNLGLGSGSVRVWDVQEPDHNQLSVDSIASRDYCPDCSKFFNYKQIDCDITTADGRAVKAIGMGDMHVKLPNVSKKTKVTFKNAIHTPDMAFMLISISWLDKAGYSITFNKGMCTIKNKDACIMATIPHSDSLYCVVASDEPSNWH